MKPPVKNPVIGIIGGRGVLGQIFQTAFIEAGFRVLIAGRQPDGKKVLSNRTLIKKADVVIVSVFLQDTEKVLREIAPSLNSKQLFCDFTSLKVEPVKTMLTSKAEVIGLHPMFGKTESLAGHMIFACPVRAKRWWPWLQSTLQNFGLIVQKISPKKHDELAVAHQCIPHLLLIALAAFLQRRRINPADLMAISPVSTQLALLTAGRLLANDPQLYTEIQMQNPATKKAAAEIEQIFDELAELVTQRDRQKFAKELRKLSQHFGQFKDFALTETNQLFGNFIGTKTPLTKKFQTESAAEPAKVNPHETIAVLGPATQTELAAAEWLRKTGQKLNPSWHANVPAVFSAVQNDEAVLGFVPLENYTVGPVRETIKYLFAARGKIQIIAELSRPIAHALLGQSKLPKNKITRIFAHPQARAQCQKFLQKNFPGIEITETTHTGESVQRAAADANAYAIGPAETAHAVGVQILQRNIEDDPNNRTRFVAIGKKLPVGKTKKTTLAFYFTKNRAGQLAAALQIFATNKVNLSRLESIPHEKSLGEFFFFTEAEAGLQDHNLATALKNLGKIAKVVILGSY